MLGAEARVRRRQTGFPGARGGCGEATGRGFFRDVGKGVEMGALRDPRQGVKWVGRRRLFLGG
jgi:hypothetical protein